MTMQLHAHNVYKAKGGKLSYMALALQLASEPHTDRY